VEYNQDVVCKKKVPIKDDILMQRDEMKQALKSISNPGYEDTALSSNDHDHRRAWNTTYPRSVAEVHYLEYQSACSLGSCEKLSRG